MFTNAGMNQFKDYFLGNAKTSKIHELRIRKNVFVFQGKHNDLEEVGVDTYHHTMFEMLGNWSFGDYFKKEAIEWSWELLTEVYKIPIKTDYMLPFLKVMKKKICQEMRKHIITGKNGLLKTGYLIGNKKDNFWEMGDTGPCGPCTEIHVDCRTDEERKNS